MPFLNPLRRRWLILVVIFFAIVLNYVDRQIVSILKPTLKLEFDMDDRGYAWLVNAFMVCYAIMYPVTGWLVDRFGVRSIMLMGIVGWSAACIGAGLTKTLGQLTFFSRHARNGRTHGISRPTSGCHDLVPRHTAGDSKQRMRRGKFHRRHHRASPGRLAGS